MTLLKLLFSAKMNWPVILIGDKGSGKSSIIKQAANLASVKLNTIVLNSTSDISDIIGSFEQKISHGNK
jgi:midasin